MLLAILTDIVSVFVRVTQDRTPQASTFGRCDHIPSNSAEENRTKYIDIFKLK